MCLTQAEDQAATIKNTPCANDTKHNCKKHKSHLKAMKYEQNLKKNTDKGTKAKNKNPKNADKAQTEARKMYEKIYS